ncbi:TolC family protein [Zhouia sp. PK063]|uniref:TolC family protein n=1 Tax=Zhouia sp. PK063 TaxID=3373602 RepID=UPI0037A6904A
MKKQLYIIILISFSAHAQQLETYVNEALQNNLQVQSAGAAVEVSNEAINEAGNLGNTQFGAAYQVQPVETRVGPQRARFSAMQMFPWFGTLKAEKNLAKGQADLTAFQLENAKRMIRLQVQKSYYQLYKTQAIIDLQEKSLKKLRQLEEIALTRVKAGTAKLTDVLQIQLKENELQTKISNQKRELLTRKKAFNRLLNINENAEVVVTLSPEDINTKTLDTTKINTLPVIAELKKKQSLTTTEIALANKKNAPQLGIGVDYILVDERSDMQLTDNGKDAIMPMVSLQIPLFNKRFTAEAKKVKLKKKVYQYQEENARNEIRNAFEKAQSDFENAKDEVQTLEKNIASANKILELQITAYQADKETFQEVIDTELLLINLMEQKISADVNALSAQAAMAFYTD